MIKIVEIQNGKITLTKSELEDLLKESYDEGYQKGLKDGKPIDISGRGFYTPPTPYTPDWYKVTCDVDTSKAPQAHYSTTGNIKDIPTSVTTATTTGGSISADKLLDDLYATYGIE